jgi:hypothetical protein
LGSTSPLQAMKDWHKLKPQLFRKQSYYPPGCDRYRTLLTPPASPRTNGMVERFNGRIEEVLQSHHAHSGEELETTLYRSVWLSNRQSPQSALCRTLALPEMRDWSTLKPQLLRNQTYSLPGCGNRVPGGALKLENCGGETGEGTLILMSERKSRPPANLKVNDG